VLFSQDAVANFINQNFEPVWESVRPVPIVRIDFGNGNVLTRTLHGNILTAVCTADGFTLDALPGIYTENVYLERLNQFRLLGRYTQVLPLEKRGDWLRGYHERQVEALRREQAPEVFAERRKVVPITKAKIERAVEIVLMSPRDAAAEGVPAALPPTPGEAPAVVGTEDVANWRTLAEDTRVNETTRRLQIHEMLAAAGLVPPEKVSRPLYKEVLHADLDDPYLGLGKVLFASYPFAQEDAAR
jgi:hypothetical protein